MAIHSDTCSQTGEAAVCLGGRSSAPTALGDFSVSLYGDW